MRSIIDVGRTEADRGRSFCTLLGTGDKANVKLEISLQATAHTHARGLSITVSARSRQHAVCGECEVCERLACMLPCAPELCEMRVDSMKAAHHQQPPASLVEVDGITCTRAAPKTVVISIMWVVSLVTWNVAVVCRGEHERWLSTYPGAGTTRGPRGVRAVGAEGWRERGDTNSASANGTTLVTLTRSLRPVQLWPLWMSSGWMVSGNWLVQWAKRRGWTAPSS